MRRSFEQYLLSELSQGKIDFDLRAQYLNGKTCFYIHPKNQDGETADFEVVGAICFHVTDKDSEAILMEMASKPESFRDELRSLINRNSRENGSNTPDFILADFMEKCLAAYEAAVGSRDQWYGIHPCPGEKS